MCADAFGHNAHSPSSDANPVLPNLMPDRIVTMARALLIKLHLYFSAFFAAAIVLVASSGGLYLIGI